MASTASSGGASVEEWNRLRDLCIGAVHEYLTRSPGGADFQRECIVPIVDLGNGRRLVLLMRVRRRLGRHLETLTPGNFGEACYRDHVFRIAFYTYGSQPSEFPGKCISLVVKIVRPAEEQREVEAPVTVRRSKRISERAARR